MDDEITTFIPIMGDDGKRLFSIEARTTGGREEVSVLKGFSEEELKGSIELVARAVGDVLTRIAPSKATAEFGIELGIESGQLTALICKGSGKANLKISLEWSGPPSVESS
jgi:hypothetical protein